MEAIQSKLCKKCKRKLSVKDVIVTKFESNNPRSLRSSCCNAPILIEED